MMSVYRRETPFEYGRFGTPRFTLLAWLLILVAAAVVGFVIGALLQLIPTLGQIAAVGFGEAWTRYRYDWLALPYTGALVMAAIPVCAGIIDRFYLWWHGRRGYRYSGLIVAATTIVVSLSLASFAGYQAYRDARANTTPRNAVLPPAVRGWLVSSLVDAEADRKALVQSGGEAAALSRELRNSQARIQRLRELLAGTEPVTRRDLERAQRDGRLEGAILGILTSLVASYIFLWLPRPRHGGGDAV